MKVVELPASQEVLARVDLSQNGADMMCVTGGLLPPRCQETAGGRLPVQRVPMARMPGT